MALSSAQKSAIAENWILINFVQANATATLSVTDIINAVTAIDNAFNTTINAAVTAGYGSLTVYNALAAVIPAPFNTMTAAQQTQLVEFVLSAYV